MTTRQIPFFRNAEEYREFCNSTANEKQFVGSENERNRTQFLMHQQAVADKLISTIQTSWGGVHVIKHEHPLVEKYLVVNTGRFLAFEKHERKVERLRVDEGVGVLIYRLLDINALGVDHIGPGYQKTIQPGQEHTIIAVSDLLIFESSDDYLGMDKDLIFLFTPE